MLPFFDFKRFQKVERGHKMKKAAESGEKKIRINEFDREQLTRAKRFYYSEKKIKEGSGATFAEFERIDELVSDAELFEAYKNIKFDADAFDW